MCGAGTSIFILRMLFQVVLIIPMSSVHYLITLVFISYSMAPVMG